MLPFLPSNARETDLNDPFHESNWHSNVHAIIYDSILMATSSVTHGSELSEPQSTLVHSRNISTVSSTTHTSTTLHSQPYEPLLRPITPASGEYYDVGSHQSRTSDNILSLPRWSRSNVNSRSPSIHDEKKVYPEKNPRRKFNLLRWSKNTLQIIMGRCHSTTMFH